MKIRKAEGSKGGIIIGHTKSGKPIYKPDAHHPDPEHAHMYLDYDVDDHRDAAKELKHAGKQHEDKDEKRAYHTAAGFHDRHVLNHEWSERLKKAEEIQHILRNLL